MRERRRSERVRGARWAGAATVAALVLPASAARAQRAAPAASAADALPFGVGERLVYGARFARFGAAGQGVMSVEGPADVRGASTYVLRFRFDARVGPVRVVNDSESWLDPVRFRALRFHEHERHPLARHDERVELYPDERRWTGSDGTHGLSPSDAPLDELSFIYLVRTLALVPDSTYRFDRHYDAARNPTTVRLVGREPVETPAGTFETLVVEMRVRDPRRYDRGDGVVRINLGDDACRLPVRIVSRMPVVGAAVLTLESYSRPGGDCAAPTP